MQKSASRKVEVLYKYLSIDYKKQHKLEKYLRHVESFSGAFKIVSPKDAKAGLSSHLADSLTLCPYVRRYSTEGEFILDIGSGAGFPAIPLAICFPYRRFVLFEAKEKKAAFLNAVKKLLSLENVIVQVQRFSAGRIDFLPALITARAVEKPLRVWTEVRELVLRGSIFLCQWQNPPTAESDLIVDLATEDAIIEGFRRGKLYIVRKKETACCNEDEK